MKEYVGIYIKTEKAQEQDGFGNEMKYHFHITITYVWLLCESGISFRCHFLKGFLLFL